MRLQKMMMHAIEDRHAHNQGIVAVERGLHEVAADPGNAVRSARSTTEPVMMLAIARTEIGDDREDGGADGVPQ